MMAGVRHDALAHLQQLSRVKVRVRPVQSAPLITSLKPVVCLCCRYLPPPPPVALCVAPVALLHAASLYCSMACHARGCIWLSHHRHELYM